MITFFTLLFIIIVMAVLALFALGAGGAVLLLVFGDVIIGGLLIYFIIRIITRNRDN